MPLLINVIMENACSCVDLMKTQPVEAKGNIGGRDYCMSVYPGERSGPDRPSGPITSPRVLSINNFVEKAVECSSAQHTSATPEALPLQNGRGDSLFSTAPP